MTLSAASRGSGAKVAISRPGMMPIRKKLGLHKSWLTTKRKIYFLDGNPIEIANKADGLIRISINALKFLKLFVIYIN